MKVLVCGSRDYTNRTVLFRDLTTIHELFQITTVIEGEARGADTLAREWAESHSVPVMKFPANWLKYGKAAGPIRNKQMLDEGKPDLVVAFLNKPLSESRGTRNMVEQAKARGIPVTLFINHGD